MILNKEDLAKQAFNNVRKAMYENKDLVEIMTRFIELAELDKKEEDAFISAMQIAYHSGSKATLDEALKLLEAVMKEKV